MSNRRIIIVVVSILAALPGVEECLALEKEALEAIAIVLYDSSHFQIQKNGSSVYSAKRVVKIVKDSGKEYGRLSLSESQFLKISEVSGKVIDQSGKTLYNVTKKNLEKVCGYGEYALYADNCHYTTLLTAGNLPYTVEYEYKLKCNSLFFWPDWEPQERIPVVRSVYTLTTPADFQFSTMQTGMSTDSLRQSDGKTNFYHWSLDSLPKFQSERFMPPSNSYRISLRFAPQNFRFGDHDFDGSSWQALSRDYSAMIEESFQISKEQELLAGQFLPSNDPSSSAIADLYAELSRRSRYVLVAIGIGGWVPQSSSETFTHGYGDCKALSAMHTSMLQTAGVDAHLALLLTRNQGLTDPEFPSLSNFNHVISYFVQGNDTTWYDPTCFACEIGDLLWYDEDNWVLAIDAKNGGIIKTPSSRVSENVTIRCAEVTLNSDLSIGSRIDVRWIGNTSHLPAAAVPHFGRDELRDFVRQEVNLANAFEIEKCLTDTGAEKMSEYKISLTGKMRKAAFSVSGKEYFSETFLTLLTDAEREDLSRRDFPLNLRYPYTIIDSVSVTLPAGMKVVSLPDSTSLQSAFGYLTRFAYNDQDRVVIVRERSSFSSLITTDEFESFQSYRDSLSAIAARTIILQKF